VSADAHPLEGIFRLGLPRFEMMFLLLTIPLVFACEYIRAHPPEAARHLWNSSARIRWSFYVAGVWTVVFFGVFARVEFIYFQF
jgi:hypothetical protein